MSHLNIDLKLKRNHFQLNLNVSIATKHVTALIGPSGAGKTTVLRAIAGLDRHGQGAIRMQGDLWQDTSHFVPVHQRNIGFVFQENNLLPHLTVEQQLAYAYKRQRAHRLTVNSAIELTGLEARRKQFPRRLSGGEQQRVALARALISNPRLLLLDEPFSHLDMTAKRELLSVFESLLGELNVPVILVTHDHHVAAQLAHQAIYLADGNMIKQGDMQTLLTDFTLPMSSSRDAFSLTEAAVSSCDENYQLTYVASPLGELVLSGLLAPIGRKIKLQIPARDVSLVLDSVESQRKSSIQNRLPVQIEALYDLGGGEVMIRLIAGHQAGPLNPGGTIHRLLSRVTRKSVDELNLVAGKQLYAQIKAVALH